MLNKILSLVFINSLILYLLFKVSFIFPDFGAIVVNSDGIITYELYILFGFIFWLINDVAKKILKILAMPLNILTLGIVGVLINIGAFYLIVYLINSLDVGVIIELGGFFKVLILSIIVGILNLLFKKL